MIWILSLITVFKVIASDSSMNFSVRESYNILSANNGHVHATTHIANIIRNGISGFNQAEIEDLKKFGISTENGKAISSTLKTLIKLSNQNILDSITLMKAMMPYRI